MVLDKGMRKCGEARCQICKFVDEGSTFEGKNRTFRINYAFDCFQRCNYLCIPLGVGGVINCMWGVRLLHLGRALTTEAVLIDMGMDREI